MLKKIKKKLLKRYKGFTLIELLIVVGIMGILGSVVMVGVRTVREAANIVAAGSQQRNMTQAFELFYADVGFYPPDVNRGWDPGIVRSTPWNPDTDAGEPPTGSYTTAGTNCSHCPSGWETLIQLRWKGPYMPVWPRFTPWKGKYDYNYWAVETNRSGCTLNPGVYIGVQGDYQNENKISESSEEKMIEKGFDFEQCINGESQMLLAPLND